jgi:hypothetical protein
MWLGEQLAEFGRVHKNIFRIQTFFSFVWVPGKEVRTSDDTKNGTMMKFVLLLSPLLREGPSGTFAHALGIPKSTLWDLKQDKDDDPVSIACTSALKPLLTQQHELLRVTFCLTKIDPVRRDYDDCFRSLHVDEKWYFISEKVLRLYIAPGEVVQQGNPRYWILDGWLWWTAMMMLLLPMEITTMN